MTKQILKTNTGSLGPIFAANSTIRDLPITSVTLETKDLKDADAYLSFVCNINLQPATTATLIFIIKKYIDKGCSHEIGSSYVFADVTTGTVESKLFSFQFIDKDIHPGKYTYSIQLASNSVITGAGSITITNATLKVLAVGSDKCGKGGSSSNSSSSSDSSSNSSNSSESSNAAENSENAAVQADAKADKKDDKEKDNKESKEKDEKKKDDKETKGKDNKEKKHKDK